MVRSLSAIARAIERARARARSYGSYPFCIAPSCLRFFLFVGFLFLGVSCSTSNVLKLRTTYLQLLKEGKYEAAFSHLEANKGKLFHKAVLLEKMEYGALYHYWGKYEESALVFSEAIDVFRRQFTVSVSNKLGTYFLSESSDIYYGQKYEISAIFYFQVLNFLYLSSAEGDLKKKYLYQARAALIEWNSFLEELGDKRRGRDVFKDSLLARMLGAHVHELLGVSGGGVSEYQVAFDLYKSAYDIFWQQEGAYPSYNLQHSDYSRDYAKLPDLSKEDFHKNYFVPTDYGSEVLLAIREGIARMGRVVSSRQDFKKWEKIYGLNQIKLLPSQKKPNNYLVVVHQGFVPPKVAKKQYYSLATALSAGSDDPAVKAFASIGATVLFAFAISKLGLSAGGRGNWSPIDTHFALQASTFAASIPLIEFELPGVAVEKENLNDYQLILPSKRLNLPLYAPFKDLMEQGSREMFRWLYPKMGLRIGLKFLAAIAAAYGTYKAINRKGDNEFLAKTAALGTFMLGTRMIANSERADTRYWSTIPNRVLIKALFVQESPYSLTIAPLSSDDVGLAKYARKLAVDHQYFF